MLKGWEGQEGIFGPLIMVMVMDDLMDCGLCVGMT